MAGIEGLEKEFEIGFEEWAHDSLALKGGRFRTQEEVDKDVKKIKADIKLRSFYLHLNPINYLKKEKPYGWH